MFNLLVFWQSLFENILVNAGINCCIFHPNLRYLPVWPTSKNMDCPKAEDSIRSPYLIHCACHVYVCDCQYYNEPTKLFSWLDPCTLCHVRMLWYLHVFSCSLFAACIILAHQFGFIVLVVMGNNIMRCGVFFSDMEIPMNIWMLKSWCYFWKQNKG